MMLRQSSPTQEFLSLKTERLKQLAIKVAKSRMPSKVAVMPDFFLDSIVSYGSSLEDFINDVSRIARQGGGSLGFKKVRLMRGGNAANTASALAKLGMKVKLFVKTGRLGLKLLRLMMPKGVNLSKVRNDGELSTTVSIELTREGRLCNIMISELGSLANYGPEELDEEDFLELSNSDFVCIFNWTSNLEGTRLAEEVFRRVKEAGKAKTFMDTSDPSQRRGEVAELVKRVFKPSLLNALGVNENEAYQYASALGYDGKEPIECARYLHEKLELRVDLHTIEYSATFTSRGEVVVPCFKVEALKVTGAGDVWNAGNIYGWSLDLSDEERLTLANAVAACYVSSLSSEHPSRKDVVKFLKTFSIDKV